MPRSSSWSALESQAFALGTNRKGANRKGANRKGASRTDARHTVQASTSIGISCPSTNGNRAILLGSIWSYSTRAFRGDAGGSGS
jgi:hypothetical protein